MVAQINRQVCGFNGGVVRVGTAVHAAGEVQRAAGQACGVEVVEHLGERVVGGVIRWQQ